MYTTAGGLSASHSSTLGGFSFNGQGGIQKGFQGMLPAILFRVRVDLGHR